MQPGRVIGRVVASRKEKSLEGARLLLVQPTDWKGNASGDPFVASFTWEPAKQQWLLMPYRLLMPLS